LDRETGEKRVLVTLKGVAISDPREVGKGFYFGLIFSAMRWIKK